MPPTYPDFPSPGAPAGNPALPGWVDTFSPPVSGGAAAGSPTIAAYTQQGGPDNCISMTGDAFSSFQAFGQTGAGDATVVSCSRLDLLGSSLTRAVALLPSSLPASSVYFLWPSNGNGYGLPVLVNNTQAQSIQCLSTGTNYGLDDGTDTCYVIGKNLKHSSGNCAVYIIPTGGGSGQYATTLSVNPYLVTFSLPTLSDGTYYVWLHNGHGGAYGWSQIPDVLNVSSKSGLLLDYDRYIHTVSTPSNGSDDSTLLLNAIADVLAHGNNTTTSGTVLFSIPNSTYYFNDKLFIFTSGNVGVGLCFQGTNVTLTPSSTFSNNCMINVDAMPTRFDGVSVVWNPAANLTGAGQPAQGISSGIYFNNMTIDTHQMASQTVMPTGGDTGISPFGGAVNTSHAGRPYGVVFKNCNFYCGVGMFGRASWLIFESCNFYMGKDQDSGGPISIWLGNHVVVRNCTFQHIDPIVYPNEGRAFFVSQGITDRHYIGDNTGTNLQNSSSDPNKGELICFESSATYFSGNVISATSNTVTVSTSSSNWVGNQLCIMAGKGEAQWAIITAQAAGVVTLDRNFLLTPDTTSLVNVLSVCSRTYIYNNNFTKNEVGLTASCLTQYFGGALDCVTDSNSCSGASQGHCSQNVVVSSRAVPVWWSLHQNNVFTNIKSWGLRAWGSTGNPNGETATCLGNVYRNISVGMTGLVNNFLQYQISYTGDGPRCDLVVFEHNTLRDASIGIGLQSSTSLPNSAILYKNDFRPGVVPVLGSKCLKGTGAYKFLDTPSDMIPAKGGNTIPSKGSDTKAAKGSNTVPSIPSSQFVGFAG